MKNLILIVVTFTLGYMMYDINATLSSKIDTVRPAYSHAASMYESEAEECADLQVMHCSEAMLVVLRTQR
jgi:hypothetical protein